MRYDLNKLRMSFFSIKDEQACRQLPTENQYGVGRSETDASRISGGRGLMFRSSLQELVKKCTQETIGSVLAFEK
jgi:hypothetical protein